MSPAMIRVEDVDRETDINNALVFVVLPGWDSSEVIRLQLRDIPRKVRKRIDSRQLRFHAQVNIGAERHEELYFFDWEVD